MLATGTMWFYMFCIFTFKAACSKNRKKGMENNSQVINLHIVVVVQYVVYMKYLTEIFAYSLQ